MYLGIIFATYAVGVFSQVSVGVPIQIDEVTIGGLKCDGIQTGTVYYPKNVNANNTYPLLSFAHGWTEGGAFVRTNYKNILEELAQAGYVVIAEHSGLELLCYDAEKQDQLRAIEYIEQSQKYSKFVNWKAKVGVYGHSMGGAASGLNGADDAAIHKHNLGAAVCLHPAQGGQTARNKLPTFYFTGSVDSIVPPGGVYSMYQKSAPPKVFAEIKGANHFECQTLEDGIPCPHRETPYVLNWFDCFIKNMTLACDAAYKVCTDGKLPMTKCEKKE